MHYGRETEHLWVHFERRYGTRSNDDGGEAVEDGFDSDSSVKAGKVEYWIRDCCGVRFVGLKNQEKAFVVGCSEGGECGYFLQRLIIFDVGEFKGTDEGCEAFGAEPDFLLTNAVTSKEQEETHRSGFFSINVKSFKCCMKDGGVSDITCKTFIRVS